MSAAVRWPLVGVIWNGINGQGQSWRCDPRLVRAYTWATLLWTATFIARTTVQGLLYLNNEDTWLGVARVTMSFPLYAVALLGAIWLVRQAHRAEQPAR